MYSILIDFDGTLVKNDETIDQNDLDLLRKIINDNHLAIISNSPFTHLNSFIDKYDLNVDIISTSSKIIKLNNKIITEYIDKKIINELIDEFSSSIYTAFGNELENSFIFNYQERLEFIYPKINRFIDDTLDFDLTTITFAISIEDSEKFKNRIKELGLAYDIYSKDRNREIIIVYKFKIQKEDSIDLIRNEYKDKKIIGVTDSYYDIDMISKCDIKIAMLNSDNKLKEISDYVTKYDNNNGGAIKLLYDICHL